MADIYCFQDEDPGDIMEAYSDDQTQTHDLLSEIGKCQKYAESQNIFERQFIARTILDTLQLVIDTPEDVETVLKMMSKLSDDPEPSVRYFTVFLFNFLSNYICMIFTPRTELMEQVPHIAMYCQKTR